MLFEFMTASEVANYTVAVFIATTVAIPFRGYLPLYGPKTARSYHLDSNSFHVADELKSANDQILDLSSLIVLLLLAVLPLIQLNAYSPILSSQWTDCEPEEVKRPPKRISSQGKGKRRR